MGSSQLNGKALDSILRNEMDFTGLDEIVSREFKEQGDFSITYEYNGSQNSQQIFLFVLLQVSHGKK